MRRVLVVIGKGLAVSVGSVVLLFFVFLIWPLSEPPPAQRHASLLIDGARIVDVERGTLGDPVQLLIRDGRIAAIAAQLGSPPPGTHRFDMRGMFLIPGLWDMHSHSWQISPQLHLPLQLASGVTAVRDMMGCPKASDNLLACHRDKLRWSREAEAGTRAGPRFIADASFFYNDPDLSPTMVADRVTADRQAGVSLLKVYNGLSAPAYRALAEEARQAGLPLAGHVPKSVPLADAVTAGQRSFEHGRIFIEGCFAAGAAWRAGRLDTLSRPSLLRRMLAERDEPGCAAIRSAMAGAGAAFVPTLVTREEDARAHDPAFLDDPRLQLADPLSRWAYRDDAASTTAAYTTAADRALLARALEQAQADTLAAHRAGVPVLVGSDTIIAGPRLHDEMALLVQAGLTPAQVLRAATLDAAQFMGLGSEYGSIAVGKRADMVVLAANPLADIGATRQIAGVMVNGHWHTPRPLIDHVRRQARHPGIVARILWGFLTSPASTSL